MKSAKWTWCVVVLTVLATASGAVAQEEKEGMPSLTPEQQAVMETYVKAAAPGPEHERLARFVGEWTVTTLAWMTPGASPQESTGTSTSTMILGGRYLADAVHGTVMGTPFEGMGWTGYDNVMRRYQGVWIDSMGTAIMSTEGSWSEDGDTFTATGEYPDAMTGAMTSMRMVTRFLSDDKHVSEFFGPGPDGNEFKMMEATYMRK